MGYGKGHGKRYGKGDGKKVDVVLELKGHCIETAAKKRYEKLVSELLKSENPEKEKELELLVEFLKNADFKVLRSRGFDGSRRISVRIRKVDGDFVVEEI